MSNGSSCPRKAASVILSTYNQPQWLRKSLIGYEAQTCRDFELIVADDGSTNETRELVKVMSRRLSFPITHVWQDDLGFRKTRILNKAILVSNTPYLIFSDGDAIPRNDFVETHLSMRRSKRFLSNTAIRLAAALSEAITEEDIIEQRCFSVSWLQAHGHEKTLKNMRKNLKLCRSKILSAALNAIWFRKIIWNGIGSSAWREDIMAANGFDERMGYRSEDTEFGYRLHNAGIVCKLIRYSTVVLHLNHTRNYVDAERMKENRNILGQTRKNGIVRTAWGLCRD